MLANTADISVARRNSKSNIDTTREQQCKFKNKKVDPAHLQDLAVYFAQTN